MSKSNRARSGLVTLEKPTPSPEESVVLPGHDACSNCRFWRGTPGKLERGVCHYNPPTAQGMFSVTYPGNGMGAVVQLIGEPVAIETYTPAQHWCGRHERMA